MNGQREEIINLLTQLGLTEYESRVYLSLLEKHPSSAYGISQVSGVPHSRVYDIARRLMRKGLIQNAGTNPARFSPLAPEELIARLTRERERIITDLGGRLESYAFEGEPEPVWNIPVRFEALDTAARLIGQARRSVYISLWDEEVPGLSGALREGFSKTGNVYVLIHGKAELDFGKVYRHSRATLPPFGERPAAVREAKGWTGPARIRTLNCSVDSSVCIAGSLDEGEACRMVWTRNAGVVRSIEESIIRSLYLAEIERTLGPALIDSFGEQLIALTELFQR